jgi:hypothetical protein
MRGELKHRKNAFSLVKGKDISGPDSNAKEIERNTPGLLGSA